MPKLYKQDEIPPYKTKEYYKIKMREYRKKNANSQKRTLYSVMINDQKYIFKSKKDIIINKITRENVDKNNDIICF